MAPYGEATARRLHAARAIRAALERLSCEGVLYKRGGGTRLAGSTSWRPRFFRLCASRGELEYSDVKITSKLLPGAGKLKGTIPLRGTEVRKLGLERRAGGFGPERGGVAIAATRLNFRLWHRARRSFDLRAQTLQDVEKWVAALDEATNLLECLDAAVGEGLLGAPAHGSQIYEVLFTEPQVGLELAGGNPTIVLHLYVDSPAERARVTRGSELLMVGDENVSALGFRRCIQKVRSAGRPLRLTLRHPDAAGATAVRYRPAPSVEQGTADLAC